MPTYIVDISLEHFHIGLILKSMMMIYQLMQLNVMSILKS